MTQEPDIWGDLRQYQDRVNLLKVKYFHEVFTPEECDRIIESRHSGEMTPSLISKDAIEYKRIRNSTSSFLPNQDDLVWIIERLRPLIQEVNEKHYCFNLQLIAPLQIIEYQEGGHYDWHLDVGEGTMATRKISLVVFLSDRESYTGGQLRIVRGVNPPDIPQNQGSCVVFPSFLLHRVEPVMAGMRYALVIWVHGTPYH